MSYICLIGNEYGIVASSDSRETMGEGKYFDNRQKVFSDKKQGLIWACCGITKHLGKDYLRLVEFIMRDSKTTFDQKLDYLEKSICKVTAQAVETLGSKSAMDILVGKVDKRTMMIRMNFAMGNMDRKVFFSPLALEGGCGKFLCPKMKLSEYKGLLVPDLKKYAHNRVESVIYKDRELSANCPSRENSVGGRVLCECIKR